MEAIKKLNLKGHLLTAISYLIPIVCGAGFLIAIGMAFGGTSQGTLVQGEFSIWDALATMGGAGLGLLPVVIATGISYSIAAKPGIAPGFIIGLTANAIGAGFIGGILGGYLAGYLVLGILKHVKVPKWAKGLMPTLIIPFIASIVGGLVMVYIIGAPIAALTLLLTNFLDGLGNSSLLIFGGVIGLLSGIDYGGPINKTVFAFVLTMQAGRGEWPNHRIAIGEYSHTDRFRVSLFYRQNVPQEYLYKSGSRNIEISRTNGCHQYR